MILVTGGTGLVGSYLLKELIRQGKSVKALYRSSPSTILTAEENRHVEWIQGDILDVMLLQEVMKDIEQIYHAAAVVTFHPKRKEELFKINVEGTANIINTAIEAQVKKLLFVSSVAAMGRIRKDNWVNETMYWSEETNNSNYGRSKYLAEMEVWRGIAEGLNAVIVNPSIILGTGNWESGSSKFLKQLMMSSLGIQKGLADL